MSLNSTFSADTFISPDSDHTIALRILCDVISKHRSLQAAQIVKLEAYKRFSGGVTHRYIVLELEREGRQQVWLRVDRRRYKEENMIRFIARGTRSRANDQVS